MKIRALLLITFLLLGVVLLNACNGDSEVGEGLDDFEELLQNMTSDATEPEPIPFAEKVYVVVSENCSGQLASRADGLAAAIEEKTGVHAMVKYDNEELKPYDGDLVIYLGNTDSLISQEAIKPLRYGDYICKWDHGSIFLGGRHDEASVQAVDEFTDKVLHSASYTSLMGPDTYIKHINDYEIDKITLNGYDLYDFTLVYDDADASKEAAELVRELTVRRSGYLMDMIPLSELDVAVGKTVTFALKGDEAICGVVRDGLNISVYGGNEYALSVAVSEFADNLLGTLTDGVAEAVISGTAERRCGNRVLNVCEACFELDEDYDVDYAMDIIRTVGNAQYDLIVFKGLDDGESEAINIALLNFGYSVKECGEYYTVLYKSEVFDSISCVSDADGDVITVKMYVVGETQARKLVCAISDKNVDIPDDGVCGVLISGGKASHGNMVYVSGGTLSADGVDLFREVLADGCLTVSVPRAEIAYGNGYRATFYSVSFNTSLSHRYFELKESVK